MRPMLPLACAALLAAVPAARGEDVATGLCVAHFAAGDQLALERRLVGLLAGEGCAPGDLLHFTFAEHGTAAAAAARHCRFDRPVLLDRGEQTHLICVWRGTMRGPNP